MQYKISSLRKLGKAHGFNLYLDFDGVALQVNGFRVMNGRICTPAITYGKGKYYTAALLPRSVAEAVYSDLQAQLPEGELKPLGEAIKYLVVTDATVKKFMSDPERGEENA